MGFSDAGIVPDQLPIEVVGHTVSVQGALVASTIALICAAVDYLHDVGAHQITVDLRGTDAHPQMPMTTTAWPTEANSEGQVVRLLLPLPAEP
jgi:hypothetical protein